MIFTHTTRPRNETVRFRVDSKEKQRLIEKAYNKGLSLAAYCRTNLLNDD